MNEELLEVNNLTTSFKIDGQYYQAIDNLSISLKHDEVLAIVGESGCGKSTLATSIIGLHDSNSTKMTGSITYKGKNILNLPDKQMDDVRGNEIGMIFQDPLAALNPLMRIGDQIKEGLDIHTDLNEEQKQARVLELLDQVGIPDPKRVAHQFPHQLSGGMRQRVIIAIAIACKPEVIIADEPTTALDVTIQAQILDLLHAIQDENHAGIILITHDLGVVAETADRVAVMYAGQIVEIGSVQQIFENPKHPYTRSLLRSMPQVGDDDDLYVIDGMVPSLKQMPKTGCRFSSRVSWVDPESHEENPTMHEVEPGHSVRCTCYQTFKFKDEVKEGER